MTAFVLVETPEGHAVIPVDEIQYVFDRDGKLTTIKHGTGDGVCYTSTLWRASRVFGEIERVQQQSEGCNIWKCGNYLSIPEGAQLVEGGRDPRG